MVRRVARLSAAESLELLEPSAGRKRRCCFGTNRSVVVFESGAGDCASARCSEPRCREQDECAWTYVWELALASPARNADSHGLRMAARTDHQLKTRGNA